MKKNLVRMIRMILTFFLTTVMALTGCGASGCSSSANRRASSDAAGEKTFVFGDTTFNSENEETNIDPHDSYCGWAAVRYGVGETLFRLTDEMELTPWLATGYEKKDDLTWVITLRDDVHFSNGNKMDGAAVKACLEDLIRVHARAAGDLKIDSIESDGQTVTIKTASPNPTLINSLSDPYACIIDMSAGNENGIVVGTGPFTATELVTDDHLYLKKNADYWGGDVHVDNVRVLNISDGDTLALALKSGEIDAAYGMSYLSYPLFASDDFSFSTVTTSRAFYLQMNFHSAVIQDAAVREAIAMGIDKESFAGVILRGYGEAAAGPFPDSFAFGGQNVTAASCDPEGAKHVLENAGWTDSDGDGIREKDGTKLCIRWLSYPSRQELPFLAEAAQASLKKIGIDVELNVTANHGQIVSDPAAWDVYAAAFVTCPTGDPMVFFQTHCLDNSVKNRGGYHSDRLEELAAQMNGTFDTDERNRLAIRMQQQILDDNAFVFCSFLRMSIIHRKGVTGLTARACDYYELTAELDIS